MDWARWLRDFALFGAAAVAACLVLRTGVAAGMLRRVRLGVGSWSGRTTWTVVLLATAALRVGAMATFEPPFRADVREYVRKAEAIADEGTPRRQEVRPDGTVFHRPLGSSLALAGWYRLTGTRGLPSARLHGIALACAAAGLILVLGRTVGRETDGRLAALGYAALLPHVVFSTIPYTETFATVLVLAASIAFERLRRGAGRVPAALALGLSCGWLAITRVELAIVLPIALVLVAAAHRAAPGRAVAFCVLALAAAAAPFAVNRAMRADSPGLLRTSSQGGLILYFGNNPIEVNGHGNATPEVAARVRELYALDPTGDAARDEAVAWMREHPFRAAANAPKKAFHLWLAEPQGFRWHAAAGEPPSGMDRALALVLRSAAYVQALLLLVLAVAGWSDLGPERRFWTWTLAAHLAIWCVLAASTRNRYPLEPWLLLAAAAWTARRAGAAAAPAPAA